MTRPAGRTAGSGAYRVVVVHGWVAWWGGAWCGVAWWCSAWLMGLRLYTAAVLYTRTSHESRVASASPATRKRRAESRAPPFRGSRISLAYRLQYYGARRSVRRVPRPRRPPCVRRTWHETRRDATRWRAGDAHAHPNDPSTRRDARHPTAFTDHTRHHDSSRIV